MMHGEGWIRLVIRAGRVLISVSSGFGKHEQAHVHTWGKWQPGVLRLETDERASFRSAR